MIYEAILSERHRLVKQIHELKRAISKLPKGNIYCVHDKNRLKWFYNNGQHTKYIKKNAQTLIQKLSDQKYQSLLLKDYQQELSAIDAYLSLHNINMGCSANELLTNPDYRSYISPSFKTLSQELVDWQNEPFETNPYHPESLLYPTQSGNIVRSKSEAIIDMLLHLNHISFRYESALLLNDRTIYPDFTIRHPKTGQFYYWEHFGMMNDLSYCKNALSKIDLYISNNIMQGTGLITTFESEQIPFRPDIATKLIEHHFLT